MNTLKPIIAFDGAESIHGRAFHCISALYYCADWLSDVECRFIDVADQNVMLAAEAFHWDVGVTLDIWSSQRVADEGSPLVNVSLYAGAVCGSAHHMRLKEASLLQVPTFLAIQFPEKQWLAPAIVLRLEAAFNPRRFAENLTSLVRQWIL